MKIIRLWRRRPVFIGTVYSPAELVAALRAAAACQAARRGVKANEVSR